MRECFTAAKRLTPKAACGEYAYKLFNGSKGVSVVFNSQYNKIYLLHDYHTIQYFYVLVNLILRKNFEKSLKKKFK